MIKKTSKTPVAPQPIIKFRQLDEAFNWAIKGEGVEEQVHRLKVLAKSNQTVIPVFRIGVGAEKYDWGIPEGIPDVAKIKNDVPAGLSQSTISLEWRRIKGFIDPNSNMKKLPKWKQEVAWCQILESVHPAEALLLTKIKDGKLLEMYPDFEDMLPTLGITEYNKPEQSIKGTKRKMTSTVKKP